MNISQRKERVKSQKKILLDAVIELPFDKKLLDNVSNYVLSVDLFIKDLEKDHGI